MRLPSLVLSVLYASCVACIVPAATVAEEPLASWDPLPTASREPWSSTSRASLTAPAAAVESADPGSASAVRDLLLDMPYNLGGFEPDIEITRGADHVAGLRPDDPTRLDLEAFLAAVGADVEDMDSAYALVSQEDFFSFVVAIRVNGAEPGSLLPAYLPILYGDLIDASGIAGNVGGKAVLVISSLGSDDEDVELFVYDQGDTIWMVQGPADVVEATLQGLPGPTGVFADEPAERGQAGSDTGGIASDPALVRAGHRRPAHVVYAAATGPTRACCVARASGTAPGPTT